MSIARCYCRVGLRSRRAACVFSFWSHLTSTRNIRAAADSGFSLVAMIVALERLQDIAKPAAEGASRGEAAEQAAEEIAQGAGRGCRAAGLRLATLQIAHDFSSLIAGAERTLYRKPVPQRTAPPAGAAAVRCRSCRTPQGARTRRGAAAARRAGARPTAVADPRRGTRAATGRSSMTGRCRGRDSATWACLGRHGCYYLVIESVNVHVSLKTSLEKREKRICLCVCVLSFHSRKVVKSREQANHCVVIVACVKRTRCLAGARRGADEAGEDIRGIRCCRTVESGCYQYIGGGVVDAA